MTNLHQAAYQAISLMDLTSLNDDDNNQSIIELCRKAHTPAGDTAAICIYAHFIPLARKTLLTQGTSHIKIATVANFPSGNDDLKIATAETKAAVVKGADEVDVVFPYKPLIQGESKIGYELVSRCKAICADQGRLLKVIIESGELKKPELIERASIICIDAGADFIKTSTGKAPVNATLEAAEIMLQVIKTHNPEVGFKAAGGIKDAVTAKAYLDLAKNIMGESWVNAKHFRFGASSLLVSLLKELKLSHQVVAKGAY